MTNWLYILVMFAVTFAVRVLPLYLLRKPIDNVFLKSFLYYVPYVTLSVMTVPAIIEATVNPWAGGLALVVGVVAAYRGLGMFYVAMLCCLTVFAVEQLIVL